ncbi:MAG: hypothetical protein FWC40_04910, partial [Proteobacteria bacterium]|nr:hypothetical protein [Pseudomonadota bacterium]
MAVAWCCGFRTKEQGVRTIQVFFARGLVVILLGVLGLLVACSSSGSTVSAPRPAMSETYPRVALETIEALGRYMPGDTEVAFFSSYGSLVEAVSAVSGWGVVSGDELGGLFRDLGMHYRLDPSKLS